MANLYYAEQLAEAPLAPGTVVEVTGDEAHHAVRVSRLRTGERILIGDGQGRIGEGEVETAERDRFTVRLDTVHEAATPAPALVLVQALAKGDRDERAIEQATEFGVDAIVPWQANRSVSRWNGSGDKAERGCEKWQRIAREAAKQSLRPRIPGVRPLTSLAGLCELAALPSTEVIALHPRGNHPLSAWVSAHAATLNGGAGGAHEVVVVVGPEGGFSDTELDRLEAAGAQIAVLGETVLRTSSAGPAALAVLNVALGRW
ncbi:16S rRNA (uracil1498-N3)-methyltransferase [Leucobacter exalbidus]|uniref:Ribosomal RNA small subunit methyltransferase E n=1 Tax=Leucobacter exalbidus TaxID=662960 RepID=A0A940PPA2_9MICO|nr:16S rRNA (uracil(1498)-N(3))-methyltransferase [Leucobacter exalbidus]MBP1325099.1 16S rRNA (uracil1498-N3)-methyltransferase [Leucobacter exalbidus]